MPTRTGAYLGSSHVYYGNAISWDERASFSQVLAFPSNTNGVEIGHIIHLKCFFEVQHLNNHVSNWMALTLSGITSRVTVTMNMKNLKNYDTQVDLIKMGIVGDERVLNFDQINQFCLFWEKQAFQSDILVHNLQSHHFFTSVKVFSGFFVFYHNL